MKIQPSSILFKSKWSTRARLVTWLEISMDGGPHSLELSNANEPDLVIYKRIQYLATEQELSTMNLRVNISFVCPHFIDPVTF